MRDAEEGVLGLMDLAKVEVRKELDPHFLGRAV